jgi:hypothetical protein
MVPPVDQLSNSERDEMVFCSLPPQLRAQIEGFAEATLHRFPGKISCSRLRTLADTADERGYGFECEGERANAFVGYAIAAAFRRLAGALRHLN